MPGRLTPLTIAIATAAPLCLAWCPADAAQRNHGARAAQARHAHPGVSYATQVSEGRSALVSDGPGTGYGFHRLPPQFRVGALIHRDRQAAALRETVETDALTSGGFRSGYLGDDVAASQPYSHYGVFSGADGYGSPFFAGYYGPGGGRDLGVLGTTYD